MCVNVKLCVCMYYVDGNDDGDRRVGGHGIVCNCPAAHMAATLASTSPFLAALKRGPSDILLACTQILPNKNGARERCLALPITRLYA